jgi:phage gpG-like protein
MIQVRIQIESGVNLLAALQRRLQAPGELLAAAEPVVAGAIQQNFDEEGRPIPWPRLAPATLRRKPAGLKILQRTGRLRRSIATRVEGGALIASTDVPYAAAHQLGVPGRLPARPFLVLAPEDGAAVASVVASALERPNEPR